MNQESIEQITKEAQIKLEQEYERKRSNLKFQRKLFEKEKEKYFSKIRTQRVHLTKLQDKVSALNVEIDKVKKANRNLIQKLGRYELVIKQEFGSSALDKIIFRVKSL